jgi:hypothetical protein
MLGGRGRGLGLYWPGRVMPLDVMEGGVSAIKGCRRLIYSLVNNRLRFLTLIATFLIVASLYGQESCSQQVKLLLSPMQLQAAIPALGARGETHGQIYFYGTPALDLLSKGVILRFREGAEIGFRHIVIYGPAPHR